MDNEKRYYIRCETRTSSDYYGPYALDEVDANKYFYMLITPECTYYGEEWSFEGAVKKQKEEYARGNRYILFTFKNGEWYYFPTEVEKGATKWEEGIAASAANTKDCTTSTTKTCTYTRLAVRQHGKTWN